MTQRVLDAREAVATARRERARLLESYEQTSDASLIEPFWSVEAKLEAANRHLREVMREA